MMLGKKGHFTNKVHQIATMSNIRIKGSKIKIKSLIKCVKFK